jgi:hypothetical protein
MILQKGAPTLSRFKLIIAIILFYYDIIDLFLLVYPDFIVFIWRTPRDFGRRSRRVGSAGNGVGV